MANKGFVIVSHICWWEEHIGLGEKDSDLERFCDLEQERRKTSQLRPENSKTRVLTKEAAAHILQNRRTLNSCHVLHLSWEEYPRYWKISLFGQTTPESFPPWISALRPAPFCPTILP
eukprot:2292797-Ditylum_brightwellii.AAC.1